MVITGCYARRSQVLCYVQHVNICAQYLTVPSARGCRDHMQCIAWLSALGLVLLHNVGH